MADEATLPDLAQTGTAAEYRQVREGGKTVADVVSARPEPDPAVASSGGDPPPVPATSATETETDARARDESGRFTKPAEGDPRKDPQAKKLKIQDEINALSKQKGETQRERDSIAAEIAVLKAERDALKPASVEPKPPPVKAPSFPSYDAWSAEEGHTDLSYDDYIDARADFRIEQREQKAHAERAEHEARTSHETAWKPYRDRRAAFKADHPDFETVIARGADVQVSPAMAEAIQTSDHGPALQYYLAQHMDEAREIAGLSMVAAVRKLDALITSLSAASTVTTDAIPHTQADAPLKTVGASPTASSRSVESVAAGSDAAAYRRAREAQLSGGRR